MCVLSLCSAGVGRTGTFIGLDMILEQAHQQKTVDVLATIKRMRTQRVFMVQSLVFTPPHIPTTSIHTLTHTNTHHNYSLCCSLYCLCPIQEQFVFLHDAVLESVRCGDTQIEAGNLRKAIARLSQSLPQSNSSGFEHEFKVHIR